jgi:outer membrane protein assembly factor BamB
MSEGRNARLTRFLLVAGAAILWYGEAGAGDWPQFFGPTRNGVSTETGLRTSWPREGPPLVWEKQVGAGFSGPVVAGERLILFHRLGDKETVECLHPATGKERWTTTYTTTYHDDFGFDEGPRATPVIAGNRVFTLGAEGTLLCLDLESGQKVWGRNLMDEYRAPKGFFGIAGTPLVEGNLVLVNVGARGAGIVAFATDTGKEVWKATDHAASYASPIAATLHGQRYAIFFTREGLVALDPANGAIRYNKRWRSRINASVNAATPLVVGDDVFISASYNTGAILLHFTPAGVEEVWQNDESMSNHYATCVYHQGHLYGFDGRQEQGARLRCVEWKTGKVCWTQESFGCGSIIVADGNLIILNEAGELVLAEATPAAYREKARASVLGSPTRAAPALANGRFYARDTRRLICLNLKP